MAKYWKSSVTSSTWGNLANWSTSSHTGTDNGGVPGANEVVYIPAGVTIGLGTTAATCSSLQVAAGAVTTITGTTSTLTITGSQSSSVFTLQSNTAWSHTGTVSFTNSTSIDINTNGAAALACAITLAGTGTYNLLNNLTIASTKTLTHTTGSLVLNNRTLYCGLWSSTGTGTRSIAFGTSGAINTTSATTSTVITYSTATNFTYTGASKFVVSGGGSSVTKTVNTTGLTTTQAFNLYLTDTTSVVYSMSGNYLNLDASGCSASVTIANVSKTIYGNLIFPSTGLLTSGTTTSNIITFADGPLGTVTKTISLGNTFNFTSFTYSGTCNYNISGNYTCIGPSIFNTTGTCNITGNVTSSSVAVQSGTVNFNGLSYSGTTFTGSGGTANINSSGTWTTFTASAGTVNINGQNSWTTFTASAGTVNINKPCTWSSSFTVSGALVNINDNVDATTFSGTAGSVYINKNVTFSSASLSIPLYITGNGNITTTNSTTGFIVNNGGSVNLYDSASVTPTGGFTINLGSVNLYNNGNITSAKDFTLTNGTINFYSVYSYIEATTSLTLTAGSINLVHADNLIRCNTITAVNSNVIISTPNSTIVRNTYSAISDFPVCTLYSSKVTAWTIVNGGTGYQIDNIITISGGTASTYALFKVTSIDASGKITGLEIYNWGQYLNIPEGTLITTGGSGTGLTLTINTWTPLFPQVGEQNKRYATTVPVSQQPNYFNSSLYNTCIIYKWDTALSSYSLIGDERCVLANNDEYAPFIVGNNNTIEWTLLTATSPSFYQFTIGGRSSTAPIISTARPSGTGNVGFQFTYTGTSTLTITDATGYYNYKYSGSSPVTLTGLVTRTLDLQSFTGVGILSAIGNINVYGSYFDNGNIFYTTSSASTKSTGSLLLNGGNKQYLDSFTFTSTAVNAPYIIQFANNCYYRVIDTNYSNTGSLTINGNILLNDATITVNSIISGLNSSIYHTEFDTIIITGDSAATPATVVALQGITKSRDGSSGKIILTSAGLVTTNTRLVTTSSVSDIVDAFNLTVIPLSTLLNTSKDIIRFDGYYNTLDVSGHRGTSNINSNYSTYIGSFVGKPKQSTDTNVLGSVTSSLLTVNTILNGNLDIGNTVNAYSLNSQRYLVNTINANNTYTVSPIENTKVSITGVLPTATDDIILNVIDAPTSPIAPLGLVVVNNTTYQVAEFVPILDGGGTGGVGKYIVVIDSTLIEQVQGSYNASSGQLTLVNTPGFNVYYQLPDGSLYRYISTDTNDTVSNTYILNVTPLTKQFLSNATLTIDKLTYLIAAVVQAPAQTISVGSIIIITSIAYKVTAIIEGTGYIGRYRVTEYTLIGNETVISISGSILNALNRYKIVNPSVTGTPLSLYSRFVIDTDPASIYYVSRIRGSSYYIDIDISRQNLLVSGTVTGNTFTLTKTISGYLNAGNYITLLTSTGSGIINSIGLGSGYSTAPGVTITAAPSGGTTATATTTLTNGSISAITLTKGAGYTSAPTLTFAAAPGGGTTPAPITAVLSSDGSGSVIGFNVQETNKKYILGVNPVNSYGDLYFKTQPNYSSQINLGVHNVTNISVYGNGVFETDYSYTNPVSVTINDTVSYINNGAKHTNLTIASTATLDAETSYSFIYIAGNYTCNGKILPLNNSTLILRFTGISGTFSGGVTGYSENKYNSIDLSFMPTNSTFNISNTYTNVDTLSMGDGTIVTIYDDAIANIINIENKFNSQAQLKLGSNSKLVFSNITSDYDQNRVALTNNSILIKPNRNTGSSPILEFDSDIVVGSTSSITPSTTHITINDNIDYYDVRKLIIEAFDNINFVYNYTGIAASIGNFFMFF
jgi:hypothetical protein